MTQKRPSQRSPIARRRGRPPRRGERRRRSHPRSARLRDGPWRRLLCGAAQPEGFETRSRSQFRSALEVGATSRGQFRASASVRCRQVSTVSRRSLSASQGCGPLCANVLRRVQRTSGGFNLPRRPRSCSDRIAQTGFANLRKRLSRRDQDQPQQPGLPQGVLNAGSRAAGEGGDGVDMQGADPGALTLAGDDRQDGPFGHRERGGDLRRDDAAHGLAAATLKRCSAIR